MSEPSNMLTPGGTANHPPDPTHALYRHLVESVPETVPSKLKDAVCVASSSRSSGAGFYTSSTLFGVTGWYEAVRSGSAAARKPSSQVLQGTPGYGLAASSSGS